jgi:2-oxoglutarate ferredoxin oxidoreductase subunit beta
MGKVSYSTPMGSVENPLNPISVAIAAEATFVARSVDVHVDHLQTVLERAAKHKGAAFVEVYQNCNVFNDEAFAYAQNKATRADTTIYLEHGKPLIFGKNRDQGIRLSGTAPEVVTLGRGITEDDLLFHDERTPEPTLAYLLSRMRHPEFPEPLGVFRAVEKPCYEQLVNEQVAKAVAQKGEGDLAALFDSEDAFMV